MKTKKKKYGNGEVVHVRGEIRHEFRSALGIELALAKVEDPALTVVDIVGILVQEALQYRQAKRG